MTTYMKRHLRKLTTIGVAVLAVNACDVDTALDVRDPDIINPADVQSPAGADAVRTGALARFTAATTGVESLFLLGGLFADEWINGDSFIARQEIDQRVVTSENTFLTTANRNLHRARLSAEQAIELLNQFNPSAPGWHFGEMYFIQAYVINMLAEHYCDGLIFSRVEGGREEYGSPITTAAAFARALALADSGLAVVTGTTTNDTRVRNALLVTKGRIQLNLNQPAAAATTVTNVPTSYNYTIFHSATVTNSIWDFNNNARRYSVSAGEGTNGLNFATAGDPRVPVCVGNDAACRAINVTTNRRDDQLTPVHVQMLWTARETSVNIIRGVDARMIEAEAALRANNAAGALLILNNARLTVPGLAPLTLQATPEAQRAQLFRERAFWQFSRGYRVGDMRRLITQYQVPAASVFPVGLWHKGGNYGGDVNFPVPQAEMNNPNLSGVEQTCINRNP